MPDGPGSDCTPTPPLRTPDLLALGIVAIAPMTPTFVWGGHATYDCAGGLGVEYDPTTQHVVALSACPCGHSAAVARQHKLPVRAYYPDGSLIPDTPLLRCGVGPS
jgi:hypothetical protein